MPSLNLAIESPSVVDGPWLDDPNGVDLTAAVISTDPLTRQLTIPAVSLSEIIFQTTGQTIPGTPVSVRVRFSGFFGSTGDQGSHSEFGITNSDSVLETTLLMDVGQEEGDSYSIDHSFNISSQSDVDNLGIYISAEPGGGTTTATLEVYGLIVDVNYTVLTGNNNGAFMTFF